ncbi:hypothetical protein ABE142_16745 [Paenibacillus alvei]|uniref:hypothetical protein n=1 Tax=Paenibacillus alvei TaxID=44250 RepID=UPI0013D9DBF5|nr:hypothetical protein [Paenibacillus alvei]NEZ42667.1 hypothetical protein [Paenibacillus alvei]
MRKCIILFTIACSILFVTACQTVQQHTSKKAPDTPMEASSMSWPYGRMIFFNHLIYVGSDEKVDKVDELLGEIELSSDKEEAVKGNSFSNFYPVGTKLYKMKGTSENEAIAVETDKDEFKKAYRKKI